MSSGIFYVKARKMINDTLEREREKKRRKAKLDRQVQAILDSEPYVSQRRQLEADRKLLEDAMRYADSVHHSYWLIKNLSAMGVAEPRKGCPECKDAYEAYMSRAQSDRLQPARDELSRQMDLLASTHQRYMNRLLRAKPAKPLVFRTGGVPEATNYD